MALSKEAQAAWEAAWARAQHLHPGLEPIRIPLHGGEVEEYAVERYTVVVRGPNWWNLSCDCKAAEYGIPCHHRAMVWKHRLKPGVIEDTRGTCRECGTQDILTKVTYLDRERGTGLCALCAIEYTFTIKKDTLADFFT